MYPGKYAISSKDERISDLINRSGGFKNMAYLKGATLIRLTEFAEIKSDLTKKIKNLNDLKSKVSSKKGTLTESEVLLIQRIDEDLKNLEAQKNDSKNLGSYAKTERISEIIKKNSVQDDIPVSKSEDNDKIFNTSSKWGLSEKVELNTIKITTGKRLQSFSCCNPVSYTHLTLPTKA